MFKNLFQSKVFRYCAIAATVVITSGAIVAGNATLQSQSQLKKQAQSQVETKVQSEIPSPSSEPDKLAELPNQDKLPDKLSERGNNADIPSGKVLKQLNLTTEQLQKLKEIRERDLTRIRELAQQSRQANKELRDLLASTESSDVIRTKHNQVLSIQQELQKQHFERMLAMREILTPQQRSQLNEVMQKNRPNRMRDGIQNRMENRMEKRIEKREGLRDRLSM
jgi:Spy/CpxP family protein refolding chaperone